MKLLFFVIVMMVLAVPVCMAEEKQEGHGLFSDGSFFSEAISSAANKIDKVTSGEERLVDKGAKGMDKDILEYDGDPLGRHRTGVDEEFSRRKVERENRDQKQ